MRVSIALVASVIALQSLQYGGGKAWAEVGGPDTIYSGGDILTMAGDSPQYVEALATEGGKIIFAGALSEALTLKSDETAMVNLKGATLLPGFIDAHGHLIHYGKNLMDADLFNSTSVADVLTRMTAHADTLPPDAWIVGMGYNAKYLSEARTPTREELDQVSRDRPVMIVDSSGHLGAGNSKLFEVAGISAGTLDPVGGNFARGTDGTSLLGPMEETALNLVRAQRPPFRGELADRVVTGAAIAWASFGQTTAMECAVGIGSDDIAIVINAIDNNLLPIDLYLCAKDSATDDTIAAAYSVAEAYGTDDSGTAARLLAARPDLDKRYINRVRLGGIKFWLDGSLDTAWFSEPYENNPPGKTGEYSGFQQIPDEVIDSAFDRFWTTDMQISLHGNGDAANEQALRAIEKAVAKYGMRDHRPVFVHGSALRADQIDRLEAVGGIPSFTSSSLVPGGDGVVHMWGEKWAGAMSAATLWAKGMPFTLNHDAPISPKPWILPLVDASVNRTTASGKVIGEEERVSPYVALLGVTRFAAWQIKEEDSKGTLEAGKLADLVILAQNPLKVPPETIKDIIVLQTIKEGSVIYSSD